MIGLSDAIDLKNDIMVTSDIVDIHVRFQQPLKPSDVGKADTPGI
jgi:hypothetical protein